MISAQANQQIQITSNGPTSQKTSRRPLTPWELPQLLTPMYSYKQNRKQQKKDRPHFNAILSFVYRNRFAVAHQIQRRFQNVLKSDRTARRHLAEMENLGILGVAPTRSTSPLWPKVYHVTAAGARRLRQALAARGKPGDVIRVDRSRPNGYTADHVLHEVLATEFLLAVWQTVQASDHFELCQTERRSLASNPAFEVTLGRRQTRLEPDAMFVHREQGRGLMCSFVELDTGSMRLQQMTEKFTRYETWAASDAGVSFLLDLYRRHGAQQPRPVFRLLVVVADQGNADSEHRLTDLMSTALPFPSIRKRVWFTTTASLQQHQSSSRPLEGVGWYSTNDVDAKPPIRWMQQTAEQKYTRLPSACVRQRIDQQREDIQTRELFSGRIRP